MFSQKNNQIPLEQKIFCNRSLNMESIKAVGFDMDYTLVLYIRETFEKLAYEETIKKLVEWGYPKELMSWTFDPHHMVRGLVVDKKQGNIIKMDRHRFIKVAYHGFRELTKEERRQFYDAENVISYEEPAFALVDTIFSLAEAFLFMQLVDLKERTHYLNHKSFLDMYNDVRKGIDISHKDGTIKTKVAQNPSLYVQNDPYLGLVLQDLKDSGHKLFIVTNSLWDYSHTLLSHLLGKDWLSFFDVVVTGAQKPNFFVNKNNFYEVDLKTGLLRNSGMSLLGDSTKSSCVKNHVYQEGHVKLLHDVLGVNRGSEILYVGDHIYGDILRSKKEIGWRTMLVIEELEEEIKAIHENREHDNRCLLLTEKREFLEDEMEHLHLEIRQLKNQNHLSSNEKTKQLNDLDIKIQALAIEKSKILELEKKSTKDYQVRFHPVWGELMKTGRQNSRFSAQVENYACLYTSKVTNLRHYGACKNFRAVRDYMPHDLDI